MDIDEIMKMLDWNNTAETQEQGRELTKKVECINVFIQPTHRKYGKNVWDNCAIILSEKSDAELETFLYGLFHWLDDMTCPGAKTIIERLFKYKTTQKFNYIMNDCIEDAIKLNDEVWLNALLEVKKKHMG